MEVIGNRQSVIRDVLVSISAFNDSQADLTKSPPKKSILSTSAADPNAENRLFDEALLSLLASDEGLVKKKQHEMGGISSKFEVKRTPILPSQIANVLLYILPVFLL